MVALAYSDVQATTGHERLFADPSICLQEWRVQRFYEKLYEIYKDHHCEALFDLGDTTDDRSAIPLPTLDTILTGINRFPHSSNNIKLIGNHEQFHKSTAIHSGKIYGHRFRVIQSREIFKIGNTTVVAVSFPESDHELAIWLKEALAKRRASEKIIVIGHFQITGCVMNSGVSLVGVPKNILEPANLVVLGHVHRGQSIGNIHYIGSPFQQDFGESNESKRVAVIDTNAATIRWVEMTGFPEYKMLTFDQFLTLDPASEDRACVYIRSPAEAEKFFAHPLSSRIVEPVYQYDLTPTTTTLEVKEHSVTPQDTLTRYVKLNPPAEQDIVISDSDMVELGLQIAGIE
jgi:DNA repair exonuclease SbcCD nuclease subunit